MTSSETRTIGGLSVEITRKSNLKNLYIHVNPPDATVTVSSPVGVSDEGITQFVLRKMPEIIKVRERMLAQERQSKREYVSGESCYLWGKPYMLQVVYEGHRYHIEKTPIKIIMRVPVGATTKNREKALTEWYRGELKRVLSPVLKKCEDRIGIRATSCNVKYMRTRWGSCNVEEGKILINLQLVKKPMKCLEYVVTHELVHLIERNHTNRFQNLVEQNFPMWREARKLLSEMPLDYFDSWRDETYD